MSAEHEYRAITSSASICHRRYCTVRCSAGPMHTPLHHTALVSPGRRWLQHTQLLCRYVGGRYIHSQLLHAHAVATAVASNVAVELAQPQHAQPLLFMQQRHPQLLHTQAPHMQLLLGEPQIGQCFLYLDDVGHGALVK